jgi:serine/threonine protein kinase
MLASSRAEGGSMFNADVVRAEFPDLSALTALDSGGQKWVYSAIHPTEGAVVLKVIRPDADLDRIAREIVATRRFTSARVPPILETGKMQTPLGECIWVREPRVDGRSVRRVLRDTGALPRADVLRLAEHVLEALVQAHAQRVIHRDIKPENLMRDTTGAFWLLDFGIARVTDLNSLTASQADLGPMTVGYAPPEQMRNQKEDVDARVDLFALGVTMHECLTSKQPYWEGASGKLDVIQRVEKMALPPLMLADDTDGRLAEFVATLGQRRAEHRPASASEALAWLREIAP